MPKVTVACNQQTGEVTFSPKGGDVHMQGKGRIVFTPAKVTKPFTFQSFKLDPEDLVQFPRTVASKEIDVRDEFTDKVKKVYKYTIVVKLDDGPTKVGDPQIVNEPHAVVG